MSYLRVPIFPFAVTIDWVILYLSDILPLRGAPFTLLFCRWYRFHTGLPLTIRETHGHKRLPCNHPIPIPHRHELMKLPHTPRLHQYRSHTSAAMVNIAGQEG